MRACLPAVFAVALLSLDREPCWAQRAPGVTVRYRAPASCPDERAFSEELDRRLGQARRPTTVVDVDIAIAGEEIIGQLLRDGRPLRRLVGQNCDEVVKALALVAALAILPPEGSPEAVAVTSSAPPEPAPSRTPLPPPRGALFVGLGGQIDTYTAPGATPAAALFVDARLPGPPTSATVRLSAAFSATSETRSGAFRTEFRRAGARIDLCPLAFSVGPLQARPCGGVALDQIRGETTGIPAPRPATAFVPSGQLFGRLEYPGRVVAIGFYAGIAIPFVRTRFIVENPEIEVHRIPAAALAAGLDLSVRVF